MRMPESSVPRPQCIVELAQAPSQDGAHGRAVEAVSSEEAASYLLGNRSDESLLLGL